MRVVLRDEVCEKVLYFAPDVNRLGVAKVIDPNHNGPEQAMACVLRPSSQPCIPKATVKIAITANK